MIRKYLVAYFIILSLILAVMSLSKGSIDKWRSSIMAIFSPIWDIRTQQSAQQIEIDSLKIENRLMKNEIAQLKMIKSQSIPDAKAIPAKVLFRTVDAWNSSLWIDKGIEDDVDGKIITKNSPVVLGQSIIGVIDYAGKRQSRVKLITDSSLKPSVRAFREDKSLYLAKGELHGSGGPLWRRSSQVLLGTGFNYDFADEKGEARDLRTGQLLNDQNSPPVALIKVNDLLVTTGMDGVFPEGWQVATVKKIKMLKEGDYFYEIEAMPTAGNLSDLNVVFVIPPLGYDESDQFQ